MRSGFERSMPRVRAARTRSKCMPAKPPPGRLAGIRLPIEAPRREREAALARQVGEIAHADEGVLQVAGDDGEILLIEGDELEEVHGGGATSGLNR